MEQFCSVDCYETMCMANMKFATKIINHANQTKHLNRSILFFFLLARVDRNKYQIHIPLPPKIDPTVTMMQVEEKPDVTYSDVGGCKEQIEKLREVVETPLLHVSMLITLNFMYYL